MNETLTEGNEEVKIAILSALASWTMRSVDSIEDSTISFFISGLKEKEPLRRAFLRCLHTVCINMDAAMKVLII